MDIGFDYIIWYQYRLKQAIHIDLQSHPSLLLTGSSGSGKSYALKYLLSKLLDNNVELFFCNFKDSFDFKYMNCYNRYYTYMNCNDGLQEFYNVFKAKQNSGSEFDGIYHILVFDEFPAFIMSMSMRDKKLSENYKMMLSEILMLGRSYGFGVWLVMQRPDSSFLVNGARDNFHLTISLA